MRITVISPSIDRQHGTERATAELIEKLASRDRDQVHLYAQRVVDIELADRKTIDREAVIVWHRVASLPGPHLVRFLGWLVLNHWRRYRDESAIGEESEAVFSAGINSFDADVILVHVVFHRLAELLGSKSATGFRRLHRKLYYSLLCRLESRIYRDPRVILAAVSPHTADQLREYFGRQDAVVIPLGVDNQWFSPAVIAALRNPSRLKWNYSEQEIVLLLVGNDWKNKGLGATLEALSNCSDLRLRLMVVGQDTQTAFRSTAESLGLKGQVEFCPPVADVREYYAAADILLAPSSEDSFNLPVLEAMACGIPVVVSVRAGISAWLTHSQDAVVLRDPTNVAELATAIRALATNKRKRESMAESALAKASEFSWDKHASGVHSLIVEAAERKSAGK